MEILNDFNTVEGCYSFLQRHFIERDTKLIANVHNGQLTKEAFLEEAQKKLIEMNAASEVIEPTIEKLDKRIFGYGEEIDALLDDPDISDIRILGADEIYYKKKGVRYKAETHFNSKQEYLEYFQLIATKNEKNIGAFNATQTFTDIESHKDFYLRISLVTPFLTTNESPYITIRKIPKKKYSTEHFLDAGFFDNESLKIVQKLAKDNASVLVIGEGGSGKTTLLNYVLDYFPRQKSVLIVQENEELSKNPQIEQEVMCLHTVSINGMDKQTVKYDLRPLIAQGLVQDINTFIIGETKSAEAYDYIIALNSGTASWTSAHASSVEEGIDKIIMLAAQAPEGKLFSRENYMRMLCGLDAVIFMKDYKVVEIANPQNYNIDKKEIKYTSMYKHPLLKQKH